MPDLQDHHVAARHLLDLGTFQVGTKRTIGIPGYLITTDRNAHILIDTGFPLFTMLAALFCYIASFRLTSVTHVAIIYANIPFCAAALSWLMLCEGPKGDAIVAIARQSRNAIPP